CSTFKTKNCKAKLTVCRTAIKKRESHSCVEIIRSETQEGMETISRDSCNEWAREFVKKMAVKLEMYPRQIYEMMLLEANQRFASHIYNVPSKSTSRLSTIRTTRDSMLLKDMYAVTRSPFCNLTSGMRICRRHWLRDIHGEWHQMLIWLPDEFMSILRYNGHTFIDTTFHIALAPFVQCLIVMAFDTGTDL
ncbi:hypothetical protein MXB_5118, partial [Myxobolus squamalis]